MRGATEQGAARRGDSPTEPTTLGGNSGGRARQGRQRSGGATGGAKPRREVRGAQAPRRRTPQCGARRSGAEQETPPEAARPQAHPRSATRERA